MTLKSFALMTSALATGLGASARALTIDTTFDSSVSSQVNAAQIEGAFNAAASAYESALATNATVNITVSWGTVDGQSLPSDALGASVSNLYGYFSYPQVESVLAGANTTYYGQQAVANLPSTSPAGDRYVITSGNAKALGIVAPNASGTDGFIEFGSGLTYTFDDTNGVASNSFDFTGVAEHEISEVLGRDSGLTSGGSAGYAFPLDIFRYASPGNHSFDANAAAYFSPDNGYTDLGAFNFTGTGDRSDWYSSATAADVQDAYTYPGVATGISPDDLRVLDVLGWSDITPGSASVYARNIVPNGAIYDTAVPEPATLGLLGLAVLGVAAGRRRGRS